MPVVTTVTGTQDSNTILTDRRVRDVDNMIRLLEPDVAPLVTATMNMGKRTTHAPKFEWLEDQILPKVTQATATITSSATSLPVAVNTGNYFRGGDVVRIIETGENVLVTATAASTLTVTRGYGTVIGTATTLATGDIVRVGNASREGDTLGTILMTKQVSNYNLTQIFRTPFGFTKTAEATEWYGGPEPEWEANKKGIEHKVSLESSFWWGQRKEDTSGGTIRRVTGGITDFIASNVTTIGGVITTVNFEAFLQKGFRYGSSNKVFFCSPLIGAALSGLALGKVAPNTTNVTKWGVALKEYQSSQGETVLIKVKKDWSDFQSVAGQWGGFGILVDLDNVKWRPLKGRETKLLPNREANDEDSTKKEYLTEGGWQIGQEQTHAFLKNVTG